MPWSSKTSYDAKAASARAAANPPIAQVTVRLYSLRPGDSEIGVSCSGPLDGASDPAHAQLLSLVQRELQAGLAIIDGD
jgi:hypothetical protein